MEVKKEKLTYGPNDVSRIVLAHLRRRSPNQLSPSFTKSIEPK